jgi:hypothetical protein
MDERSELSTLYWDWVRSEAALIDTDGCTGVSGLFRECCWEHDLAFWYAKNPRVAYLIWLETNSREFAWQSAPSIDFDFANKTFRKCHVQRTKWGNLSWLNPMVWWRWRGVTTLSKSAWDRHRAREEKHNGHN